MCEEGEENISGFDVVPHSCLPSSLTRPAYPRLQLLHQEHRATESLVRCYFHSHPKGTGVICKAKEGLKPDTFVSEYLG